MMARLSLLFKVGYRVVGERFGVIHGSPVLSSLLLFYTFPFVYFFYFNVLYFSVY